MLLAYASISVVISRILTVDKLESFFQHFPEFPNAFLVGGPADVFVIELTDQVRPLETRPNIVPNISLHTSNFKGC